VGVIEYVRVAVTDAGVVPPQVSVELRSRILYLEADNASGGNLSSGRALVREAATRARGVETTTLTTNARN
jgi:hypothetical protein